MEDWSPEKLFELSRNYWIACTIHGAVKLDVFSAIGNEHLTSEDIAQKLNGDKRGITMLLNALTALHLLVKIDEHYANTSASISLLSKDSPHYIGYMIMHHHQLVDSWSQLAQAVKTGRPVRIRASQGSEEGRTHFLMGMYNLAMHLAPRLVTAIDLSNRSHLLDLGGGPGTYAIHFCLHNPQLKATVYDLSTTRPFAENTIEKFGLTDRIDFRAGNYLEEEIEGRYDVAWLSHILHGEGPEDCQRIIQKAVSALEPGGMMIIHDFILNNTMDGPLFPALFSLNMLLGTPGGQSYAEKQIMDMLVRAGVKEMNRMPFKGSNDSGIIIGIV